MDGAAGGPPPELIPGYYDDRSGLVIFCVTFCLVVATLMVTLRIWTRKFIINKMGADDWAAIIALVITWGEGISIGIGPSLYHFLCVTSELVLTMQLQRPNTASASTSLLSTLQLSFPYIGRFVFALFALHPSKPNANNPRTRPSG